MAVKLVCYFSHVKEVVIDACYLYCLAVKLLILHGDPKGTYQEVKRQAKLFKSTQNFDGNKTPISVWFDEIE